MAVALLHLVSFCSVQGKALLTRGRGGTLNTLLLLCVIHLTLVCLGAFCCRADRLAVTCPCVGVSIGSVQGRKMYFWFLKVGQKRKKGIVLLVVTLC